MFNAFLEVLNIDSTHNTNTERYKLFSFMMTDALGSGQYVQHAIIENETESSLLSAIQSFKDSSSSWNKVKVIVVDKDFMRYAF